MSTVAEAATPYLRARDVFEILDELGIERKDFWKLVEAGTIERIVLRKGGRGYYLRAAVNLHLVQPFRAAEERLSSRCSRN